MREDIYKLSIFVKIIEHGSFRGAAKQLGLSPSVVSHHLSDLEEKLGVALLYRSTRQLTLTQDGARILAQTHNMLKAIDEGLNQIKAQKTVLSGQLKISLPTALAKSPFMQYIACFRNNYPNIRLELNFLDERINLIKESIDLAFKMAPYRKKAANRMTIFKSKRILIATDHYLRTHPKITHPSDTLYHQWIELIPVRRIKPVFLKGEEKVKISFQPYLSVNDTHGMYHLVRAHAGLALVPDFMAKDDIANHHIIRILPEWELQTLETYAEWPSNVPRDHIIRLFVSEVQKMASSDSVEF